MPYRKQTVSVCGFDELLENFSRGQSGDLSRHLLAQNSSLSHTKSQFTNETYGISTELSELISYNPLFPTVTPPMSVITWGESMFVECFGHETVRANSQRFSSSILSEYETRQRFESFKSNLNLSKSCSGHSYPTKSHP